MSLTGSPEVGRLVGREYSQKSVSVKLELGGKSTAWSFLAGVNLGGLGAVYSVLYTFFDYLRDLSVVRPL